MTYRAVDCQGFAGGYTLGTVRAGFELVGKRELVGGFGVPNCEANRHLLGDNWETEIGDSRSWSTAGADYVFGNPPCSGFSGLTEPRFAGMDAKVNSCMWAFAEFAGRAAPLVASFESVSQAFRNGRPLMQALRAKLEEVSGHRYDLYHVLHNAYDLGGVAKRRRYFWLASRVPFGVDYPEVRQPLLRDAWDDLAGLGDTWLSQPYRREPTWWSARARSTSGTVDGHVTQAKNPGIVRALDLLEMAEEVLGGWGPGEDIGDVARAVYQRAGRLPDSWAHKVDHWVGRDFDMGFTNVKRWDPNRAGRVIIGGAPWLVLHPFESRFITYREAARVMGFPDDWHISTIERTSALPQTWGKGITVQCGEWISNQVRRSLDGETGSVRGELIGDREWLIEKPKASARRATDAGKISGLERSAA